MQNELLPCPFCKIKGNKIHIGITTNSFHKQRYRVICGYCGAFQSRTFSSEIKAIEAWNTRADNPTGKEQNEY